MNQPRREQRLHQLGSQPLNVHRVLGGEVLNSAGELRRAGTVGASPRRALVLIAENRLPAGGADGGEAEVTLLAVSLFGDGAHHLRDDVSRFLHDNGVPDVDVTLPDEVLVMQRRAGNGGSRQTHRRQNCGGGQHAGAPHGNLHVQQFGFFLLGREFVSHRPFRGVGALAEYRAVGKAVDLDDHAVNVIGQGIAQCPDFPDLCFDPGGGGLQRAVADHVKAEFLQPVQRLAVQCRGVPVKIRGACLKVEHENVQFAFRRNFGVKLTKGPSRRVSRVGKKRLPCRLALFVQFLKNGTGHIDLSAHRKGERLRQGQRDGKDGFDVGGHVLADKSVTARGALHQHAVPGSSIKEFACRQRAQKLLLAEHLCPLCLFKAGHREYF